MSSNIDTNVSNYTLAELMVIVDLNDLDPEEIIKKTDYFIEKYKTTDPNLSIFFQSIKDELLQYEQPKEKKETKERKEENNKSNIEKQTKDWNKLTQIIDKHRDFISDKIQFTNSI